MNSKNDGGARRPATRRTPQKTAIAAYLAGHKGHPCAEEIHQALRKRFPTMSLSTVYNTLRSLQKDGRIHELAVGCGKGRFDPESEPHHHLVCLECRTIVDVKKDFELVLAPAEAKGFHVLHSHVGFYGTCPDCLTKAKKSIQKEMS